LQVLCVTCTLVLVISDMEDRLREWRHWLHQRPELGFEEVATSAYVADLLRSFGLAPHRGIGGTGVVASLVVGSGSRTLGLRADMDALPLVERTGLAYAARDGRMHACGHDGHMAMLLGAAAVLAAEGGFDGTVRFFFQPAEEHGRGAQAMLDDGLLERFPVDQVYGLHNLPGLPAGELHTRPGPIMASEDTFEITITGRGGHAAAPHLVVDPIVVAAEVVLALQTIVSRSVDPGTGAVLSCTEILTDGARNAIPGIVTIKGDTRSFDPDVQSMLERRMRQVCAGVSAAHGATCSVTYRHEFVPTINDPTCVAAAVAAATAAVGADRVDGACTPVLASEDFALLARQVPGCFTFIGNGVDPEPGGIPLHSSGYDFNDHITSTGVAYYVELVQSVLAEKE
jgi:amidohydrolase